MNRLAIVVLNVLALAPACTENHVGQSCDLASGEVQDIQGRIVTIAGEVAACPSGICIGPADAGAAGTGAVCSASCESNDDCEDGERANKDDPADSRCRNGFVCMWPTTSGRFACRRLCVCRDLVTEPAGGFQEPAVCL
jgi:hypothetical protein